MGRSFRSALATASGLGGLMAGFAMCVGVTMTLRATACATPDMAGRGESMKNSRIDLVAGDYAVKWKGRVGLNGFRLR